MKCFAYDCEHQELSTRQCRCPEEVVLDYGLITKECTDGEYPKAIMFQIRHQVCRNLILRKE
jgi:hypothetical protein